jgi:UDP-glucose 4-epimerase
MKIAITGGAGFIASHIADAYIADGHEVHIIDNLSSGSLENINPKAVFHHLDINDEEIFGIFKRESFDLLNHHAAQMDVRYSVANPKEDAKINIIGGLNLYEAANQTGIKKIILASTGGAIYGEQDYFPADEEHPTRPCSPYGIAKLTNEKYLYYYKEVYGLNYAVLRYANIYGPRQSAKGEAGVVSIFCNKLLKGEQAIINGDGKNSRDYVFVSDVVKANIFALRDDFGGIYNIGTEIETDVNYIYDELRKLTNSSFDQVHGAAKAGEQRRSVITSNKFFNEFAWKPSVQFDEGLKQTVEYFRAKVLKSK